MNLDTQTSKIIWIAAFIISLLTIFVYLPALDCGFVNWDDNNFVYANPNIWNIDPEFFVWAFTTFQTSDWFPLTWISHALDYSIWELDPKGHHLTNLIFHGLNTILVVLLVTSLINRYKERHGLNSAYDDKKVLKTTMTAASITGLLFGLHPLNVESVVWISERKNLLYSFFYMLSILSYLKYASFKTNSSLRQTTAGIDRRSSATTYYLLCLFFFVLSLMSKPMAVTLPVVLIILDFYPLGRTGPGSLSSSVRKLITEKIPFVIIAAASAAITLFANQTAMTKNDWHLLGDKVLIASRATCFYLLRMFQPLNLAPYYPYRDNISLFQAEYLLSVLLCTAITIFCIAMRKKNNIWLAAWAYYLVTLLPVLGFIQTGGQLAAADRYTYMPGLAPYMLLGLGTAFFLERAAAKNHRALRALILVIAASSILVLSLLTQKQINVWNGSFSLWDREVKAFPDFFRGYLYRGVAHNESGRFKEAIADFDKASSLSNSQEIIYVDRGISYASMGNDQKALEDFTTAIMINPHEMKAFYNRGLCYMKMLNYKNALQDFDTVISRDSGNRILVNKSYLKRGDIRMRTGQFRQAVHDYTESIGLFPRDAATYNKRGIAYTNMGDYQSALRDFDIFIRFQPRNSEAYNNRGSIHATIGNVHKALKDFDMAIRLDPDEASIYFNRGMLHHNSGNKEQALSDLGAAARLGDQQAREFLKQR